ncbi:MAG: cysteine rich repeat-containing protein [Acidobacteriota bacterium]|nr:cysteine rich repeat-containing protein [Acidobacteriota bacterium]
MSRSTEVFLRCAVAVVLAVMVDGALRPQSLYAQAASTQALPDVRAACAGDVQKLCAGVPSGGGRIIACLKQHQAEVSDGCKQALVKAMRGPGGDAGSGTVAPASPPVPEPTAPAPPPSKPTPPPPSSSASRHGAPAASAASGSYLVLKKAQIKVKYDDPNEELSPAIEMLIPSTWDFQGAIHMYGGKTGCFSESFSVFWEAKSPDSLTKFQGIPNYAWQYSDDPQELHNLTDPNRRTHTGNKTNVLCAVAKPLNAEQYFRQMVLNDLKPAMTVVSIEPFSALEQLVRQRNGLPPADSGNGGARIDAIRVRLAYQKDNQPMELWYSLALVTQTYRVGRGFLYDLHAVGQVALGAPMGKLDGNEKLFKVVMSSIQPTPRYAAYTNKWIANFYQIQANKEAKMDQIQADLDKTITETYLHMSNNAQRVSDIGFHATDQNLRDVQTYRDPSTGRTFELSNQYGHAWLNGANQYVMSDDPNFNPNANLSGNWTQLQAVQP